MEPRRIIRTDIAASVLAHLSLVALVILVSEVHPFQAAPTETVAVDIVTPDEVKPAAPEPAASPPPAPAAPADKEAASPAPVAPSPQLPQTAQPPQPASPPPRREANAQPQMQTPPAAPAPSYTPPQPDLTVKYGVLLGLPQELPPAKTGDTHGDAGDANASTAADLSGDIIAEFRRHLRTCAKLPASIAPSDVVMIKLRAVMTADGRLAADPILIEASASAKGPILMQSARSALVACQPYTMLPAEKFEEWRVLDLTFTPGDFDAS